MLSQRIHRLNLQVADQRRLVDQHMQQAAYHKSKAVGLEQEIEDLEEQLRESSDS